MLLLSSGACLYGFAGGGLPRHVRTVAVQPFDNLTPVAELQREITDLVREELRSRLGLREAPADRANGLVRGVIQRYEAGLPIGYEASNRNVTSATRLLQIIVDVEFVDQVTGKTLWQRNGLTAEAQYEEGGEPQARREAIARLVTALVEGAQSQW